MSAEDPNATSSRERVRGILLRAVAYPVILLLLLVLSQGPAAYLNNKSVRNGGRGLMFMDTVYPPINRMMDWCPLYYQYVGWWCEQGSK